MVNTINAARPHLPTRDGVSSPASQQIGQRAGDGGISGGVEVRGQAAAVTDPGCTRIAGLRVADASLVQDLLYLPGLELRLRMLISLHLPMALLIVLVLC